jgi:hypothetical protein
MMMIGDGLLGSVGPARHCRLWQRGPAPWKRMVSYFAQHPKLTRAIGLAETGAGFWLATRQRPLRFRGLPV